jgi:hypothetical protein
MHGQRGRVDTKDKGNQVFCTTIKRLEALGTMRADFLMCGMGSQARGFLYDRGAVVSERKRGGAVMAKRWSCSVKFSGNHMSSKARRPKGLKNMFLESSVILMIRMLNGRCKSTVIEAEKYLLEVSRYLHLNAVRGVVLTETSAPRIRLQIECFYVHTRKIQAPGFERAEHRMARAPILAAVFLPRRKRRPRYIVRSRTRRR